MGGTSHGKMPTDHAVQIQLWLTLTKLAMESGTSRVASCWVGWACLFSLKKDPSGEEEDAKQMAHIEHPSRAKLPVPSLALVVLGDDGLRGLLKVRMRDSGRRAVNTVLLH